MMRYLLSTKNRHPRLQTFKRGVQFTNAHSISGLGDYRYHGPYDEGSSIEESLLHLHSGPDVSLGCEEKELVRSSLARAEQICCLDLLCHYG